MTQVLFLSPPRRADGTRALFNNATLTLASYLMRREVSARIQPLMGPYWIESLVRGLHEHDPEVAAISCKWWDTLYGATEVARLVKSLSARTRTVAGGQTATSFALDLVNKMPFDAVVRGDGERPLWEYATGAPTCNLTTREEVLPTTYVQSTREAEDLRLLEDLTGLADPAFLECALGNAPFVWTGKGCRATCMYCAGSALGHKKLFGRTGYMYRPVEHVVHDMEVLAPWTGGRFMFDFDPITDPAKGEYYGELFQAIPRKKYHVAFYSWSLPSQEFLEKLLDHFLTCVVALDAQTYSEPLRKRLAEKAIIKPFSSNQELEDALEMLSAADNVGIHLYGIVGLCSETTEDVQLAEAWLDRLASRYLKNMYEMHVTPLSAEPGALVDRDPDKYGMVAARRSFEDYLDFTRMAFRQKGGFHGAEFGPALPHPYGLFQNTDSPDRVYRDYLRMQGRLKATFQQRSDLRAREGLRIEPDQVSYRVQSHTQFGDDWMNLAWAACIALERGIRRLVGEAREAWVRAPSTRVLEMDEDYEWTAARWPRIRQAMQEGRLEVEIRARPEQNWGFWQEAGARLALPADARPV